MALTLSVGFVVDDAIVMLENIDRTWRWAKTPSRPRSKGRARSVHDPLDDDLARRRVHPVSVMGGLWTPLP
jgi:Cu/Ag efflux pump CusA